VRAVRDQESARHDPTNSASEILESVQSLAMQDPEAFGELFVKVLCKMAEWDRATYEYLIGGVISRELCSAGLNVALEQAKQALLLGNTDRAEERLRAIEGGCARLSTWARGAMAENETRYSPAKCIGADMKVISGNPDPKHVSTSFVERQNLTMRMQIRRFTRLTNGFSKKVDNHRHSVALHYMFYNYCRIHQTLRCTPAMEAGVADHVWAVEELCSLLPKPSVSASNIEREALLKALGEHAERQFKQ
jgi:hypothetical protein